MEKYLPFYLKFDEISREKNGPIRWRKSVLVGPKIFSSALRVRLQQRPLDYMLLSICVGLILSFL